MTPRAFLALALAAAPLITGCVHASAKTVVTPPLTLPEEPARQPVRPPVRPAPAPAPPTRAEAPARQEPPPPKVEPPAPEPRVADEAPRAPTTLQTTPAGAEVDVVRAIRVIIDRASADLKRVNYRALNSDGRTQYDTAKRFIAQADDAVTKRNLVLARSVADKALAVAAQLASR